jgi:hypothetical protein
MIIECVHCKEPLDPVTVMLAHVTRDFGCIPSRNPFRASQYGQCREPMGAESWAHNLKLRLQVCQIEWQGVGHRDGEAATESNRPAFKLIPATRDSELCGVSRSALTQAGRPRLTVTKRPRLIRAGTRASRSSSPAANHHHEASTCQ